MVENGAQGWGRIIQDAGRESVAAGLLVEQRSTEVQIVFNVGVGRVKVIVAVLESSTAQRRVSAKDLVPVKYSSIR